MLAQLAVGSNSANLFLQATAVANAQQPDLYNAASQQHQLLQQQHQQQQQHIQLALQQQIQQQQQQLFRNQFGLNRPNAIMVSSSTPSLMSSAVKAQQHTTFCTSFSHSFILYLSSLFSSIRRVIKYFFRHCIINVCCYTIFNLFYI